MSESASQRINKLLALHLGIGRRQADTLLQNGRVQVNGKAARLGQQIKTDQDQLMVDGKPLVTKKQPQKTYLLVNKPVSYVCSRRQQGANPTIYTLLPKQLQHLQPVGRLDKDSSGLLLLTNDGDFALHMTHPRFAKRKVYEVRLDRPLSPKDQQKIQNGIQLQDGLSKLQLSNATSNSHKWQVTMHEGRNRQIRRTFAALGYKVVKLHRIEFGPFTLMQLGQSIFQEIQPGTQDDTIK